jgi:PhnB protein
MGIAVPRTRFSRRGCDSIRRCEARAQKGIKIRAAQKILLPRSAGAFFVRPWVINKSEELNMIVQNYLTFDGRCEEAIEFYKRALGAQVQTLMRFKDVPQEQQCTISPGTENKVMHAVLRIGDTSVMASDGHCRGGEPNFQGFSLSIQAADTAEADKVFAALSDGGNVTMPLAKTFFSPRFGMVDDRFGVHWIVVVAPEGAASQRTRTVERAGV